MTVMFNVMSNVLIFILFTDVPHGAPTAKN